MGTLCVIAARGGSKGLPGKNIRMLLGKPVIVWAIEKALESKMFEQIAVSTDSPEIAQIARKAGADVPFMRPAELALSNTGKFQVWQHALEACEKHYCKEYDTYVDIDCTNPLIETQDIINSINQFKASRKRGVDAVFTVSNARRNPYFNLVEADAEGALKMSKQLPGKVLCRQEAPEVYEHVAGVYVLAPEYLRSANHLLDGHAEGYEVPEDKHLDIDSETDFLIIEYMMKLRAAEGQKAS
ncbi:MAG: acylneuraminate cytidylyltransferase family protein [Alphaproteobacteria bacterium]|nr:acylneuraminate cytidylyltransferase family protein [Alphaproteobacteria bacterium]